MQNLSVVIITFNEERNIARCLDSIKDFADDIVVVDSFSTDRTEEICREYAVNFVKQKWIGYSEQKNFANSMAKYDFIFSLDADEAVSPELKDSILEIKKQPEPAFYRICRITNYCGKWIRHSGWYPDIKVRFFDRRISKWEDMIHERLSNVNDREASLLKGHCYHYSYYSISGHLAQAKLFSELTAENLFIKGKKAGLLKLYFSPVVKFLRDYIFHLGFLDGHSGFLICKISARATFLKYSKLRKLHQAEKKMQP